MGTAYDEQRVALQMQETYLWRMERCNTLHAIEQELQQLQRERDPRDDMEVENPTAKEEESPTTMDKINKFDGSADDGSRSSSSTRE